MTPAQQSLKAAEYCRLAPVVPVIVVEDLAHAAPLARALVAGGQPTPILLPFHMCPNIPAGGSCPLPQAPKGERKPP